MQFLHPKNRLRRAGGFTLVELLVVIAIISVLMTLGAIGINSLSGGKGVSSAVSQAEAIFHFARQAAVANNTRARVLIPRELSGVAPRHPDNRRRLLVAIQDPETNEWRLTDRGEFLPQNVYFSELFSLTAEGAQIQTATIPGLPPAFAGTYYFYEFNSEGVASSPAARFIVGNGVWPPGKELRVASRNQRDFGGFVIWRNGRTSLFRSPDQMNIPASVTTF